MWKYNPKIYVFKWEMPFFTYPPSMGQGFHSAEVYMDSLSFKNKSLMQQEWNSHIQRVQINYVVHNTLF